MSVGPHPKIDLHTHILPERWPDWTQRSGYAGWISLEQAAVSPTTCATCARMVQSIDAGPQEHRKKKFFRDIASNCWDPDVRLREMATTGVCTQVLSTVPVMFSYWAKPQDAYDLARLLNDHIAGVCREHARSARASLPPFLGLATLPMQDPVLACRELERCVRDLHLPGVQIGTNVNGRNLDDAGVFEVLTTAERLDACVFVHPWDMLAPDRMEKYWLKWLVGMPTETALAVASLVFSGTLDRLPKLRVCFAHGGGSLASIVGRLEHGHACRPDLVATDNPKPPSHYLRRLDGTGLDAPARFWVDSLTHDPGSLRELLRLIGPQRTALGSDYPFPLGEDRPGAMIESMADLTSTDRDLLLHGAARAFLAM